LEFLPDQAYPGGTSGDHGSNIAQIEHAGSLYAHQRSECREPLPPDLNCCAEPDWLAVGFNRPVGWHRLNVEAD
jgi:hypothetical protein